MATIERLLTMPGVVAAKSIQLRGSWDGYSVCYPLAKDDTLAAWKGTFSVVLQPGSHQYYVWKPSLNLATLL